MANPIGVRETILGTLTVRIDTNLSGKEGYAVNFDATDDLVVNLASDQTLPPFVLIEGADGSTTETTGTIALIGSIVKVKLGENVTAGKFLVPTASGTWEIADAAGERYGVVAIENGSSGDLALGMVTLGEVEATDA